MELSILRRGDHLAGKCIWLNEAASVSVKACGALKCFKLPQRLFLEHIIPVLMNLKNLAEQYKSFNNSYLLRSNDTVRNIGRRNTDRTIIK